MKKYNIEIKVIVGLLVVIILLTGIVIYLKNKTDNNNEIDKPTHKEYTETKDLEVVPTMLDNISLNAAWTPTFELIWKDAVKEIAGKDIVFTPQEVMADNLNKSKYDATMISDAYLYKKYGFKTLELKKEIEEGIKEKFNQTSDILEDFDWTKLDQGEGSSERRYFLYSMLYREFEYKYEFSKLENSKFNNEYNDIKYFGLNDSSKTEVRNQIKVLFYENDDNFAVSISTKNGDEVVFYKNPTGTTFENIYNNLKDKTSKYNGTKLLNEKDTFKAPVLELNVKREYNELCNKVFETTDPQYPTAVILKALQTIEFKLDEKGGTVKSEAGMEIVKENAMTPGTEPQIRHFDLDSTYAIFVKEESKDLPYLALKISDITKFQK